MFEAKINFLLRVSLSREGAASLIQNRLFVALNSFGSLDLRNEERDYDGNLYSDDCFPCSLLMRKLKSRYSGDFTKAATSRHIGTRL